MKLKIISYRDLDVKDEIFILWLKSFGFYASPAWLERFGKYEPALGDGPVGMCALLDGKLVGFVGVMQVPTRTKTGEIEMVGGIYGVATRPSISRKGIGRRLLEESEQWLRRQGIRLSFLTTSTAIVAYNWYAGIGYVRVATVDNYKHYYKVFRRRSGRRRTTLSEENGVDMRQVRDIFNWYVRNRCGFVIRSKDTLKAREMQGIFNRRLSLSVNGGYALLSRTSVAVRYCEILARTKKAYGELIRLAEPLANEAIVAIHPFDPVAQEMLRRRRYTEDSGNFDVLMVKSLDGTRFEDLYDDTFMIARIDWF
jgi:GNAT superfamily N-acetyltransferase